MVIENQNQGQISLFEKWQEEMNLIQEKTGIKGIYVVLALILSVIFVYLNIFDSIITNLVGTLYPAFWTIKSIEKNDQSEQKNWLTYWAVFGFFILIDMFSPIIVKFIPFYLVLKILFLIWMFMPGTNGSKFIYEVFVKRILKKYAHKILPVIGTFEEVLYKEEKLNYNRLTRRITKNNINMYKVNQTVLELNNREIIEERLKEKEEKKIEEKKEKENKGNNDNNIMNEKEKIE